MGMFRFLLSIMVLLSHTGVFFYGFGQGTVAVVVFYVISGFTTTIIYKKRNIEGDTFGKEWVSWSFEKVFGIYPLYFFWVIITASIFCSKGFWHET